MKPGMVVKGEITAIKPYGAFVKVEESYVGLIHISEFSNNFVRSIEDYVNVGDVLDLQVLKVTEEKLSLSYKVLHKKKKRYHIELKAGFTPLEENLANWISSYELENSD